MIQYTKGQQEAIEKALNWYYLESYEKKYFILGGLAGTGKSTVINALVNKINLPDYQKTIYSTFTAKASLVLRMNGLDSNTIHKTFYRTYKDPKSGRVYFSKKNKIDDSIKLIIIDEAAMASDRLIDDILSFGVPTILSGDPNQLGPVAAKNTYMFDVNKIDALLTEIMRQQEDSGILKLATKARLNEPIRYGDWNESKVVHFDSVKHKLLEYDAILTWKNSTRREINSFIRKRLLNRDSHYPVKGDKILCLDNNYNYEMEYKNIGLYLINGLVGIAKEDFYEDYHLGLPVLDGSFRPDFIENRYFKVHAYREIFDMYKYHIYSNKFEKEIMKKESYEGYDDVCLLDYGYALTVNKAQGSGFDNVLVIDEFRGSVDARKKWLYTAITRAKKSVTIATVH